MIRVDEVIHELFQSFLSRYQIGLETSMKSSDFIFDSVHLLYHKCHKIDFKQGGSKNKMRIKNRKATINLINEKDNKCFQYAITVALNDEILEEHPERITEIKPL